MSTKEVKLSEATPAELRDYGRLYLGLAFDDNTPAEKMLTEISKAIQTDKIIVPADPAPRARAQAIKPPRVMTPDAADVGAAPGQEKVLIRIMATRDPGGDQPVPVGVNGSVMLIPRNRDVEIPRAFYEVLRNAVEFQYDPDIDAQGRVVGVKSPPREVPAYPFSLLRGAA